jgi:hypothetical protein
MVEPGTGLTVLGSAPIVLKILGPTADYVGDGLQQWTERRGQNIRRVFEHAEKRLGKDGLDKPGAVPPRVLKEILEAGSYCDDELGAAYFGGILASSKSAVPRDDRGATLAALAARLSTYQLRCHYLLYSHAQRLLVGSDLNLGLKTERLEHGEVFVPWAAWVQGMDFNEDEFVRGSEIAGHALSGLRREDLIDSPYGHAGAADLRDAFRNRNFPEPGGIVFTLSLPGIELFVVAHGHSGIPKRTYIASDLDFEAQIPIPDLDCSSKVRDLPERRAVE